MLYVRHLQIFDKALDEPSYSSMYAQLCSRLHTYNPNSDINKDKQNTVSLCALHVCTYIYLHISTYIGRVSILPGIHTGVS